MKRPARVTGGHRGLRLVHALLRIVLVCALVVLLALIAVREVQGIAAAAVAGRAATSTSTSVPSIGLTSSAPTTAPSPAGALPAPTGGRA
jgi:hypothetical protein